MFSLRRSLFDDGSRKMSDGETETLVGHDPSYLEQFVGADDNGDGFVDFEVEPDTFHGLCCAPSCPFFPRVISNLCLFAQSNWQVLCPTGKLFTVIVWPLV